MSYTLVAALVVGVSILGLFSVQRAFRGEALLLLSLAPISIGFGVVCDRRGLPEGGHLVLAAPLVLTLGLVWGYGRFSRRRDSLDVPRVPRRVITGIMAVLFALTALHFWRVGIAVFATEVETQRFALGSSGLFGLPSRAVLFGLPILALVVACQPQVVSRRQYWSIWGVFVLTRLLLGFKGGLIEVLIIAATGSVIRGRAFRPKTIALMAGGLAAAITYGVVIGGLYTTVANSGGPSTSYFKTRLSVGAAEPAWYMLNYRESLLGDRTAAGHDARFFLSKYAGLGSSEPFATDQLVSSVITETPRSTRYFIVPVTVGGPAYLLSSGGWPAFFTGLVALGFAFAVGCARLAKGDSLAVLILAATVLVGVRTFVLNGGGLYVLINLGFTAALLLLVARLSQPRSRLVVGGARV